MSNWGIRVTGAAKGITTPVFYCWRVDGVSLPGHALPCVGWIWGLLPGHARQRSWDKLRDLPTEAPMNRQRARREVREMANARTRNYRMPRAWRRDVAASLAKSTLERAKEK